MAFQNHLVDPTFFYDAIEEFAFDFDWYPLDNVPTVDPLGKLNYHYRKETIRGSLQTQGARLNQNVDLNTEDTQYRFFCKSLYRISIGDFIVYKNRYLRVNYVHDYDEWGVRRADLQMVELSNYKDFVEFIKYLNGQITV